MVRRLPWLGLVIALAIVVFSPSSAFACIPVSDEVMRCDVSSVLQARSTIKVVPPVTTVVQVTKPPVAVLPRGDGPTNAIPADDQWMTIAPGASVWFKMDNGRSTILDVWVDANGQSGLNLAVFAPDISAGLSENTKPTGRGTFNRLEPGHDLRWRGQSPNGGTWYALVTNSSSASISYKVGFVRTAVQRQCGDAFWEYFPSGAYVQWPGICK